ncbi:phytanoyl-CoA dioxygenase family protein [Amycolatopsis panacis]|uniref:Phytanoyl-CoA dioxygenase n=1 Tax=Amycolatopsis panacis TaxID=2340917 RepID=A0A419IAM9_9PSEU|nr:hypothetical protein [Amycolatopsis panacis]RJQ90091.1 hypothetical protein D5S19_03840 [Amycolatopsis panacis]
MQDGMAWHDEFFRGVAVSRRLGETSLALMGADEAKFILDLAFIKPAEKGRPTAFHQDWPRPAGRTDDLDRAGRSACRVGHVAVPVQALKAGDATVRRWS